MSDDTLPVKQQSLSLTDLSGVGEITKNKLEECGYRTISDVQDASEEELVSSGAVGRALASRIVAHADILAGDSDD